MNATTKLVVENSRKEKNLVLRLKIGKDLEDLCESEEEIDQYSVFLHVGRGLCSAVRENFDCFQ